MKIKKIGVLLLTVVLTLGLFPMSISVFATTEEITNDSKASITVENAVANDKLEIYKVIDITYDAVTNQLAYTWNSDFADYFAQTNSVTNSANKAYTIEDFAKLTSDSDDLKNLLAGLPNYIANKTIAPVDTQIVVENGTATFLNLAMGEYFIRPTSSTSVYQLMLQKIEPIASSGAYQLDDVEFTAKKEEVSIAKTADKTSVTKNEKVAYTVTVDIPTYDDNTTDKSFYISDLLPDGLKLDPASIKVSSGGTDITDQANTAYTLDTGSTADYTFKLSVSTAQYTANWATYGGQKLIITYSATLNSDDTTAVNTPETNTATFDYSNYPYVENSHEQKTDTVDVTTFAIQIDKYDKNDKNIKLNGATFDLYRTATQAEIDANTAVDIPLTVKSLTDNSPIKGILLESNVATGATGEATFEKYEANDTNYNYYLVETQAPSGYNILDNAVQVNFTDADVEATAGIYTVEVPNSSGFKLPVTGGEGVVLFTIIGIALMSGAVFLFIISRKKSKANYKR